MIHWLPLHDILFLKATSPLLVSTTN
jgi:hypothetical protein